MFLSLFGAISLSACSSVDTQERSEQVPLPSVQEEAVDEVSGVEDAVGDGEVSDEAVPGDRVVRVLSDNWSFTPALITAKQGEKVTLEIVGVNGVHGFAVPGLGLNAPVAPGETTSVILSTDTVGSFDFFCSIPCGAGHRDMVGKIVVEE